MTLPPRPPFRIKICGVTHPTDAAVVARSGGDAIGLNFYSRSCRFLMPEVAREIVEAAEAAGDLLPVGVFVNVSLDEIRETVRQSGIRAVQLHGDEPVDLARRLVEDGVPVIRAVRLPSGTLTATEIEARIQPWSEAGCAILLDADAGAAYGGQGMRLDWPGLRRWAGADGTAAATPFALAGGLTVDTVADAIRGSGAASVDVASGVERERGKKCHEKIERFIAAASEALESESA